MTEEKITDHIGHIPKDFSLEHLRFDSFLDLTTAKSAIHSFPPESRAALFQENPLSAAMLLTEEAVKKYGSGAMGFYKFKGLVQDSASRFKFFLLFLFEF